MLLSSLPPPLLSLFPLFTGIPLPVAPAGHPSLLSTNVLAGGGYNISLRPINETVMEASATTVLIKIQSGQSTYYLWKVNILSLSLVFLSLSFVILFRIISFLLILPSSTVGL